MTGAPPSLLLTGLSSRAQPLRGWGAGGRELRIWGDEVPAIDPSQGHSVRTEALRKGQHADWAPGDAGCGPGNTRHRFQASVSPSVK